MANPDLELAEAIADFYADPLGFVRFAYPWGESGPLREASGPDGWQTDFLGLLGEEVRSRRFDGVHAVAPIRMSRASGHGIGKSTIIAFCTDWVMSTRPRARGTVSANTSAQLQDKTWAAIARWTGLCITGHWFKVDSEKMFYRASPKDWFCVPRTCRRENSEAFAGQHAADSSSYYFFDEASAIPDVIWDVAEGGLTDGEPIFIAFGNPTRSSGRFHQINFGSARAAWNHGSIDSRTSAITNKEQIEAWLREHGENSDFFRVRVRGLPPAASDLQYIDSTRVFEAQRREVAVLPDEPLIVGVDVARGGDDNNVFRFRRGRDARSIPEICIPGERTRDSMLMVQKLLEVADTEFGGRKPDYLFVDGGAMGGPIVDRCQELGRKNIQEVGFGFSAPDVRFANMRAWMWSRMRDWLLTGAIDESAALETDLVGPGYKLDKTDRIVLEAKADMKKRGMASPDHGDALALTFAQPHCIAPARDNADDYVVSSGWMA